MAYDYTSKWTKVAIVCDGTRVLGLGDIGPEGAIPVIEGKSVLFKVLGDINAYPLCLDTRNKEEIIRFVKTIQPIFGAVNIEDIQSPKSLEIVERHEPELSIPVFHDDQHGTAIIVLAALLNSLKILHKKIENIKLVIAGAGSAGYGIFKILKETGCQNIVVTDSHDAIYKNRSEGLNNPYKKEIAENTNTSKMTGSLLEVIKGSDFFIGVSGKGDLLNKKMVNSMNVDSIIFAISNPDPEFYLPMHWKGEQELYLQEDLIFQIKLIMQ